MVPAGTRAEFSECVRVVFGRSGMLNTSQEVRGDSPRVARKVLLNVDFADVSLLPGGAGRANPMCSGLLTVLWRLLRRRSNSEADIRGSSGLQHGVALPMDVMLWVAAKQSPWAVRIGSSGRTSARTSIHGQWAREKPHSSSINRPHPSPCPSLHSVHFSHSLTSSSYVTRFNRRPMPKLQNMSEIRKARLAARESPADATDDKFNIERRPPFYLPDPANALREALYANGRQPSDDEKEAVYHQILAMVGPKYTSKAHSNFCTKKQRERTMGPRYIIAAKMQKNPNPTMVDLLIWKNEIGVSLWEVFRIVEVELSEVVKQTAQGECLVGHEDRLDCGQQCSNGVLGIPQISLQMNSFTF
ncbi:hypothetical protein LXA43DRAFT_513489 [Ganoderma leucocontextum]|nr:hypothetical protein LXA43DRAFT_513489 [Ganoderma leucocontextum]